MIWLELRKENKVYNSGWNFTESIWAPVKTKGGRDWPFWSLINKVVKGEIIFHLRSIKNDKKFVGYSIAATDGYLTHSLPTNKKHKWDFTRSYYKVDLKDFKTLTPEIALEDFFKINYESLINLFKNNKSKRVNKKRIFFVIQKNRLQCLNGAYFSEFDDTLPQMLIDEMGSFENNRNVPLIINAGVHIREIQQRIGQDRFSTNVKLNYNYKCCFPNCEVEGRGFLIGSHIDRWKDNESLRGHTGNGLCFCLMHDKAFEKGFFTIDENFCVVLVDKTIKKTSWLNELLSPSENLEIKSRKINPSLDAIKSHWERIGYKK